MKGAIFDLDGVLVDTAVYHFAAWKELANKLGFEFTQADNERLKGVSRMKSLEILLSVGNIAASDKQKEEWAKEKNERYVKLLENLNEDSLLSGAKQYLTKLHNDGILIALGSASKNAPLILKRTGIEDMFDAIVDGNSVSKAKPDPEIFLKGAELLGLKPQDCTVFEDSQAGIESARAGGFSVVAVDKYNVLKDADKYVNSLADMFAE